ncbi:hypothetical protein ACFCXS_07680 [Streptomyces sp. NPDC056373]|uniref:hypothetical protein n=1 Tax=Streptomyces sp. NPDC056373 TaxID=3345798 RepID=UPI0035E00B07
MAGPVTHQSAPASASASPLPLPLQLLDLLWIPPGWSGLTLLVRGAAGPKAPELRVLRLESSG